MHTYCTESDRLSSALTFNVRLKNNNLQTHTTLCDFYLSDIKTKFNLSVLLFLMADAKTSAGSFPLKSRCGKKKEAVYDLFIIQKPTKEADARAVNKVSRALFPLHCRSNPLFLFEDSF